MSIRLPQLPDLRVSFVLRCLTLAALGLPAVAQTIERVSLDARGGQIASHSAWGTVSGNGRVVAFGSDDPNLVAGDTNGETDVFVRDLRTGVILRASETAAGVEADGPSFEPVLSRDGRFVAFSSWATNLARSDANGTDTDVFVKDLVTGSLEHVSVSSAGVGGDGISAYIDLSADGRFVTWYSYSTNLVPGDTNGTVDAFLFDRVTRTTERVSVATGGTQLSNGGGTSSISDDGRFVAFEAWGADLGFQGGAAIALRDRQTGTTRVLNVDSGGVVSHATTPRIAGDGSVVAFSTLFGLVSGDTNFALDVYAYAVGTGTLEWISAPPRGLPAGRGHCSPSAISTDGRFVVFSSDGVFDASDTNTMVDVFVHDRLRQQTDRVSVGLGGLAADAPCSARGISADSRFVVFGSEASNLVIADTNGSADVFVVDRCKTANVRSYGQGLAGTAGLVPPLGLAGLPTIGTTPALAIGNSAGTATPSALLIGIQAIAYRTPWQGTLLVAPLDVRPLLLPATGLVVPFGVPYDLGLCGAELRLQSLVVDPGAPAGIAFSRGLELTIGG